MRCFYEYTAQDDNGDVVGMCGLSNGDECTSTEREWCKLYWKEVESKENSCMRCKYVLTDQGPCATHSMFYCMKHKETMDPDDMPTWMCTDFIER